MGVRPSQAAYWRPDLNAFGSGVFITSRDAPIGPTPGILVKARLSGLALCQARSLASMASYLAFICAYCSPSPANSSRIKAGWEGSSAIFCNKGSIAQSPWAATTPNSAA